jgi:phosphopantothenoylcysteine decarboxylase / phosphopantothenate---cysteine ligase
MGSGGRRASESRRSESRRVVLGVCGSIAAYKAADLCSKLVQRGDDVSVIMTRAATQLVGPITFAALTGRNVATEPWDREGEVYVEHIDLADRAEVFVVAPATANFLAKAAVGIADDMLTSTLLAVTCPVVVAPAMNTRMWRHKATVRNVAAVRELGYVIVEPGSGFLACRDVGEGRLADTSQILERIDAALARKA